LDIDDKDKKSIYGGGEIELNYELIRRFHGYEADGIITIVEDENCEIWRWENAADQYLNSIAKSVAEFTNKYAEYLENNQGERLKLIKVEI
jgi:hypothetical protein